jgi:mannitol/fructose-specific phosphotransferase system IIA component (Ntr-type)
MTLLDLIRPEIVKVPLLARTKDEAIREMIQILIDAGRISEFDPIYRAIWDREALGSTGLENGIAVPHAKAAEVKDLELSIGISPGGIDFQAMDGRPSQLFFLILAPPGRSGPHIELLSEIARITRSGAFCRSLVNARNSAEVVELFRED